MKTKPFIIFFFILSLFSYLVLNVATIIDNKDNKEVDQTKYCSKLTYKESLVLHPNNF